MRQRQKYRTLLTEKKNNNKNKKGRFGGKNRLTKLSNTLLKIVTEEGERFVKQDLTVKQEISECSELL